jgi:pimeloyl-ACP methyl ester carboxylesterase
MSLEVITRQPVGTAKPTPILCVHGILHGAWCWDEYWLPYLAQKGYVASALSLRGHGKSDINGSLRFASVHDYVQDVHQVAQDMQARYGTHPILIGHSMGGLVVQKYLEKYEVPGAVLLASVPTGGVLRPVLSLLRRYPRHMLYSMVTWQYAHLRQDRNFMRHFAFSHDMPDSEVDRHRERMGDESFRTFLDMLILALPRPQATKKTRMLVLCAENDTLFSVAQERKTAEAYGATFHQVANTAHDMMLENTWRESVDVVLGWLES